MPNVTTHLTESQFLLQFGSAIVVVIGLMALWREWLLGRARRSAGRAISLDRYEIAWLTHGRRGAVQLAIRNLIRNGELAPDSSDPSLLRQAGPQVLAHPFEAQIYHTVARRGQMDLNQIQRSMTKLPAPARLLNERLIQTSTGRAMTLVPAMFVVPALLFVGASETVHLLINLQPVTPAVLLTVGGALISAYLCIPTLRTRQGEATLAELQLKPTHAGLPARWVSRHSAKAA